MNNAMNSITNNTLINNAFSGSVIPEFYAPLAADIVLLTFILVISIVVVAHHAWNCYSLPLQKNAVRVLLLAPVYAGTVIASVFYPPVEAYADIIGSIYESYMLHVFFAMIIQFCGGSAIAKETLEIDSSGRTERLFFLPGTSFRSGKIAYNFIYRSVSQLVFTRPILVALSYVFESEVKDWKYVVSTTCIWLAFTLMCYSMIVITRAYFLLKRAMFHKFHAEAAFLLIKCYINIVICQHLVVTTVLENEHFIGQYRHRFVWHFYSVVVTFESFLYMLLMWYLTRPELFHQFSEAKEVEQLSCGAFLVHVLKVHHVARSWRDRDEKNSNLKALEMGGTSPVI